MANTINETQRLVKRLILNNLGAKDSEYLTPMLSGSHGLGKTAIVKQAAKELGAVSEVLEASMLSEGEICGLPIATKNPEDDTAEVQFAAHPVVKAIKRAEKYVYEKARKEGFFNHTLYLDEKGRTHQIFKEKDEKGKEIERDVTIDNETDFERAIRGKENSFKFGENLDFHTKLALITSGEIQLFVILIDELNRTDIQTMKELMNILLTHVVNGYKLPWWVQFVSAVNPCGQNSTYAVNELDDAQLDRFIKIPVTADINEWVDFGIASGMNRDLLLAVSSAEEIFFMKNDTSHQDQVKATPSPRSWSMIGTFMSLMETINETKFFAGEERKKLKEDFNEIVMCKVGPQAGRTFLSNLENKVNLVKPADIFTGKEDEIDPVVFKKLKTQKTIQNKVVADSVVNWLTDHWHEFSRYKKDNDMKVRVKYTNFVKQVRQYVLEGLDDATRYVFLKKIRNGNIKIKTGQMLMSELLEICAKEIAQILQSFGDEKNIVINDN